ncbi:MAG: CotH kinase family protein [Bacteroidales bacterium]|nr:CotH kinase family protein [Bacteroidales bacterium]
MRSKEFMAILALAAGLSANGQLVINELMQSNIDCIMDDLNDFPDSWLELYNPGTIAVDIEGYTLSLNADGSEGYVLPSYHIIPQGYFLIYCDKVGEGFHASFRIDSGKGSLYLFDQDGNLVDGIDKIKKQPAPNIAYGRVTDGSDDWGYQLTPTPGTANTGEVSDMVLGEPEFSQPGGVWKSVIPFDLELTIPDDAPEGAIIRYTTDGTEPTLTNGKEYTGAIRIAASTVVRAKVMADGCLSIPSTAQSYIFLGRDQKIPLISIITDQKYLYDKEIGIFVEGKGGSNDPNYNYNWRRPINLEYFPVEEDAALNQLCEMRVQGGWTRQSSDLKSVAIYANKRFGTKRFEYEFWPTDKPGIIDNKSIILRHGGNDFGFGYIRDALCQRMMGRYVDIDWQGYAPAIIYLNGKYHAMLAIRERSNEDNIYSNYDGLEDIDMIENWYELKAGDWDNCNAFTEFYSEADGHSMVEWRKWMDVEEYTDMMILASWVINDDFPHNNIVMWRPRAEGGKWRWVLKDFDFGLGIWDSTEHKYTYDYFNWLYNNGYYDSTRLYRRLMLNPDYKQLYVDRFVAHTGDFLTATNARALLDEILDENQGELKTSDSKWGFWWQNLDNEWSNMRTWITNRHNYLPKLLKKNFDLGDATKVQVNQALTDDELEDIELTYAGVELVTKRFDGTDYVGRTIRLVAEQGVKGWNVIVGNGQAEYIDGASMEMAITTNANIVINAVPGDAGISSVVADKAQHVRLDRTSGIVYAEGPIEVYDLQGRLILTDTDAAQLPARGCYVVNNVKILW